MPPPVDTAAAPDLALAPWAALLRKSGVGLGRLPLLQQRQALALVWAGLPRRSGASSEVEINAVLKGQLAGAAAFLATDHVELRRWLVDAGWLRRDGWGRAYSAAPYAELTPELQAIAAPLQGLDVAAWAAAERDMLEADRQVRRRRWQSAAA